jgi:AcrR family transcriptional regulator
MTLKTSSTSVSSTSRAGRPRNPETEREIIAAAANILIEEGYGALTMEGVAARANVGKMTVYRRWKSRSDLVLAVLDEANRAWSMPKPRPEASSVAEDLRALYRNWVSGIKGPGKVIPILIAEAIQNPDLAAMLHERFVFPRRLLAIAAINRAIERGEISSEADSETAIDMLLGRMWFHQLVTGKPIRAADEEKVISLLLNGLKNI